MYEDDFEEIAELTAEPLEEEIAVELTAEITEDEQADEMTLDEQ